MPGLAEGGIVTKPTLIAAGERGAEAIIPLDRVRGSGGGVNLSVNVNGAGMRSDEVMRLIQAQLRSGTFRAQLRQALDGGM